MQQLPQVYTAPRNKPPLRLTAENSCSAVRDARCKLNLRELDLLPRRVLVLGRVPTLHKTLQRNRGGVPSFCGTTRCVHKHPAVESQDNISDIINTYSCDDVVAKVRAYQAWCCLWQLALFIHTYAEGEMLVQNVLRSQIAKILIRDKSFVCLLLASVKFRCAYVCVWLLCICIVVASLACFFFFLPFNWFRIVKIFISVCL